MALIACPDCGGSVSDAAPACIHCGRPFTAPAPAPAPLPPAIGAARTHPDSRAQRAASAKPVAFIGYGLQVLAFLYFIPAIVGLVMAYLKRGDARGTWVESHFDWQIETFWNSLWWVLGGIALSFLAMWVTDSPVLGTILLYGLGVGVTLWYIYRIVRGALALNDGKPIA